MNPGAIGGEVVIEQANGAAGDSEASQRVAPRLPGGGDVWRRRGAGALLQIGHHHGFVGPEPGRITSGC